MGLGNPTAPPTDAAKSAAAAADVKAALAPEIAEAEASAKADEAAAAEEAAAVFGNILPYLAKVIGPHKTFQAFMDMARTNMVESEGTDGSASANGQDDPYLQGTLHYKYIDD